MQIENTTYNSTNDKYSHFEEEKMRARRNYYKQENTFEHDMHTLQKELITQYQENAINNFLLAESTALATETEALLNPKVNLVTLTDMLLSRQKALTNDKNLYAAEFDDIYRCKEQRIEELEQFIERNVTSSQN